MKVQLNLDSFEMDVRGLLMSFFPKEELQVDLSGKDFDAAEEKSYIKVWQQDDSLSVSYIVDGEAVSAEEEKVTTTDRKQQRDQVKRMLYRVMSKGLNKKLAWGTLSGIRPVKMVRTQLEAHIPDDTIRRDLDENYYISPKKRELMLEIAHTELEALRDIPYKDGYSLYVGIPFCPSTCAYCSFTSYPLKVWEKQVDAYVDLLCKEIDVTTQLFSDKHLCTIYVGGGTPTILNPAQLDKLLKKLREVSSEKTLYELTVEAGRPDSVTREKLEVLRAYGVDRISINPQTMNDSTLTRIGRRHSVAQTIEAYELARSMGFDNINMDLILGLPGEGEQDVRYTMEEITKLAPDSLTVHSLAIKRAARLNMFKEDYAQYQSVNTEAMMDMVQDYARSLGLVPYYLYRQKHMAGNFENVGYAKSDKIALYNILIMEEMQTIAAVGAGGSTKIVIPEENRIERVENVKEVRNYMERFEEMLDRKRKAVQAERICKE